MFFWWGRWTRSWLQRCRRADGGYTEVAPRVLAAAGGRAELLPQESMWELCCLLVFHQKKCSRVQVCLWGRGGWLVPAGLKAPVLVQPVVLLGSWTKCWDPHLICVPRSRALEEALGSCLHFISACSGIISWSHGSEKTLSSLSGYFPWLKARSHHPLVSGKGLCFVCPEQTGRRRAAASCQPAGFANEEPTGAELLFLPLLIASLPGASSWWRPCRHNFASALGCPWVT